MKKRKIWLFTALIGFVLVSCFLWAGPLLRGYSTVSETNPADALVQGNSMTQVLGIVKEGKFYVLWPEKSQWGETRLTKIQMQEAVAPESREINLAEFEGQAIMAAGNGGGGGWLYEAQVIDSASPIVTVLVQELLIDKENE